MTGEMSVKFDIATGRIWAFGTGFWSLPQATAFFDHWKLMVERIHAAGQSVSALAEMSRSSAQIPAVAAIIADAASTLYRAGDAVGFVVATSLSKMQMRRVVGPSYHAFFLAREEADAWLDSQWQREGARPHLSYAQA